MPSSIQGTIVANSLSFVLSLKSIVTMEIYLEKYYNFGGEHA